ncbi:MAG: hypothetical protein A2086_16925 [Spirochaetes bacterium GWD1_27_9]|nr:MAG: hypothetical protein A2Z98_18195 [Spirochaetes bacterium GWB1_27_13]OHD27027.1 MAG: hypothetical protein A2Y34_18325 [Spirochaetes bacterium GWC1_27_15]OHD29438.1 MAG: hypothetical protein A2086_16925 [Spirochaetes bacterium GWD1_27_9]
MNFTVISYSLTGNNESLAGSIAKELSAKHIRITENKPRTVGMITFDMIFNRTPKINLTINNVKDDDIVIFVAPVWMWQVASPLRECFKRLKSTLTKYVFISISGGADGPNSKLANELTKRIGKKPKAVIDLHIASLLPIPKPTREDTSSYHLNEKDVKNLTNIIMKSLQETLTN